MLYAYIQRCLNSSLRYNERWRLRARGKEKRRLLDRFQQYSPWIIHKSLQTQVWIVCVGSTAEQKPLLNLEECHGGKALSFHKGKAGTQQGSSRYQRKGSFTLLLPSLVLALAVYMLKSRHLFGSVLLKPASSSAEQATDSWFVAIFRSPSPARLQCCTCSTVLRWTSHPQTDLETRPLSLFIPLSNSQLISAAIKAGSQTKQVLLNSSNLDKVSYLKTSRHSWFHATK